MNFTRKFYNTDVADGGGGETETVVEEQPISGAAELAKFGQKSDENGFKPVSIPEKKEVEKPVVEETATAKVEEVQIPEKPTSETQQETKGQVEEPKKTETPPIAEQTAKVPTLDEVLKTNQPDTVLKALGFDDEKVALIQDLKDIDPKLVGIIQAWKSGQLGDYVKELSTDYSKMEAEEVMRHQLRVDYPKATERQLEILYKKEIVEKYNLDSVDDDEVEEGKELLAAKADKYRDSFIANQDKFLMPKPPEPKQAEVPDNTAEQKAKENVEKYVKEISDEPYTKDIFANKKITIGEGEEKFTFDVEPQTLIDNLSNPETWVNNMFDKDTGKPKTQHQMLVATVAQYGTKFLDAYAVHLKGLGAKEVINPIENASEPDKSKPSKSEAAPNSPAANLATRGVRSSGGY